MWNNILDAIWREQRKADHERYLKVLKHIVARLTEIIKKNDENEVVPYGRWLVKALEGDVK